MGGTNEIGKEVVTFYCCFRWVHHVISKTFFDLNMEIGVTGCQNFEVIDE